MSSSAREACRSEATRRQSVCRSDAVCSGDECETAAESVRQFEQLVMQRPEVLECHSMSGANDYLLRIVAASMEAYEHFLSTQLLQLKAVRSVNTSFVLRTKKFTTRLPVG